MVPILLLPFSSSGRAEFDERIELKCESTQPMLDSWSEQEVVKMIKNGPSAGNLEMGVHSPGC